MKGASSAKNAIGHHWGTRNILVQQRIRKECIAGNTAKQAGKLETIGFRNFSAFADAQSRVPRSSLTVLA